jgi:16S rRNA (uracil1498-N3)-methyltransferase
MTNDDKNDFVVFVGPEGGFSDSEFAAMDAAGAVPVSLGKTILRAETAAVALLTKFV